MRKISIAITATGPNTYFVVLAPTKKQAPAAISPAIDAHSNIFPYSVFLFSSFSGSKAANFPSIEVSTYFLSDDYLL